MNSEDEKRKRGRRWKFCSVSMWCFECECLLELHSRTFLVLKASGQNLSRTFSAELTHVPLFFPFSVFRHLILLDPDTFWFTLNELHCPSSYIPPHPDLQPVRLSGMGRPRDEYSDNVLKLLKEEFGPDPETADSAVS